MLTLVPNFLALFLLISSVEMKNVFDEFFISHSKLEGNLNKGQRWLITWKPFNVRAMQS